ncbi:tRNA pseudouridine(38-40) synthase TruA [Candidatus Hepatincolaceae symbiont of Richtersius coronifer]
MYRYKIYIEYNGTNLNGWQSQKNAFGVQEAIEKALISMKFQTTSVVGAGRTDAGVHAIEQIAHFDCDRYYDEFRFKQGLNYYLKTYGIAIAKVERLLQADGFHARYDAKSRSYIYKILNRNYPETFDTNLVWWIPYPMDVEKMQAACQLLIGTQDLSTFRARGCQSKSPVKTINEITITKDNQLIIIFIKAPSFMYHQVRNIVGALSYVATGIWTIEKFHKALLACDRTKGSITAPAKGLYLFKVEY